jgi:hypothetical protein
MMRAPAQALRASGNRDSKLVSGAELGRAMRAADREKEEARYKVGGELCYYIGW